MTDTDIDQSLTGSLPESVVRSVLDRWGYGERGSDADPEPQPTEPEAPAEVPAPPAPEPPEAPEPATGEPTEGPEPTEPVEPPQPPSTPAESEPEVEEIPAPGGPIWTPEEPAPGTPPQPPIPPPVASPSALTQQQIEAYRQLEQRIQTDPAFRVGLQALLNPQNIPAATPPGSLDLTPLPQLSPEDIQDPATQALVMIAHRQQQEMAQLRQSLASQAQQSAAQQRQETLEIANNVRTSFARQYNLPDTIMDSIDKNVVSHDIAYYMQSVEADPYKAAEFALTRAYWNTAEARTYEFERQAGNRAKALARKQRLSGVGGGSGSSPRTPPPPDLSTPEARHKAAVAEAASAMGLNDQ